MLQLAWINRKWRPKRSRTALKVVRTRSISDTHPDQSQPDDERMEGRSCANVEGNLAKPGLMPFLMNSDAQSKTRN